MADGISKRTFLKSAGGALPALKLVGAASAAQPAASPGKFTPLDCSQQFNASSRDFGPREQARRMHRDSSQDALLRVPGGERKFRGIPFLLGPENVDAKRWMLLSNSGRSGVSRIEVPVNGKASFVCVAQFCDWDPNEAKPAGVDAFEKVGQHLGDATLVYTDGSEQTFPLRRRFEVNSPSYPWGHQCFAAVTHRKHGPAGLTEPLPNAMEWGETQTALAFGRDTDFPGGATLWLSALENPRPDQAIKALRMQSAATDALVVCGVTLFNGRENPLRYERAHTFRVKLPADGAGDWDAGVDLGVVIRSYLLPEFDAETWLRSETAGLGEPRRPAQEARLFFLELTASPEATLTLQRKSGGPKYEFDLRRAFAGEEVDGRSSGARVQIVGREKSWVRAEVLDKGTGRPTPVRLSIRSAEGRYIPPYGHRTDVNSSWFQDYGADLKWGDSQFAYVDGAFQVELPVGEVFFEVSKGFEYEPVRRRIAIAPGQRELRIEISRIADLRSKNWVSADSHVHFLSPTTAVLEGQAEGVNLVNLLAAQWGDLFTNVGDLPQRSVASSDGETMVRVGTENRQHLMGHLALLGTKGDPVFPMSADGPDEGYLGTPMWNTLAEWADRCRERDGLVVAVHFPYPTAELAADVVLGKIDAVELWPSAMDESFNTLRFFDWYRFLNCGYRLPAVGGTDKMGAWIPVGAHRAYAYLGQDEFSFDNWAKAVRGGNTFMTSGPLLFFEADGRVPGSDIRVRAGGGTVEVRARVQSAVPIHRLEIIANGKVVSSREEKGGAREMSLTEKVRVPGPGWLAARCASRYVSAGTRVAAHTSPVYVVSPGEDLFSAPAAAYMMTLIDGADTYTRQFAIRPGDAAHARALKILADARARLHERMHRHGIKH